MKYFRIALCALVILATNSCSKKDSGTTTPTQKMFFSVNNLSDIAVKQYVDTTVYVAPAVTFESGEQETMTLTPSNLPSGVTVTPASIGGTPSFSGIFTFHISSQTAGTSQIKIVATTASGTTKNYTFNINASANSNCGAGVAGLYTVNTTANPTFSFPTAFPGSVTTTSVDNVVNIPTFYATVTAHLNCANQTFTTDAISSPDINISVGSGTYTGSTINLSYTLTDNSNGSTHAVTATLTR